MTERERSKVLFMICSLKIRDIIILPIMPFSGTFLRENFSGDAGAQSKTAAASSTVNAAVVESDDTPQHTESEEENGCSEIDGDDGTVKADYSQNAITDLNNERTTPTCIL